jgi:hypothetical protein
VNHRQGLGKQTSAAVVFMSAVVFGVCGGGADALQERKAFVSHSSRKGALVCLAVHFVFDKDKFAVFAFHDLCFGD